MLRSRVPAPRSSRVALLGSFVLLDCVLLATQAGCSYCDKDSDCEPHESCVDDAAPPYCSADCSRAPCDSDGFCAYGCWHECTRDLTPSGFNCDPETGLEAFAGWGQPCNYSSNQCSSRSQCEPGWGGCVYRCGQTEEGQPCAGGLGVCVWISGSEFLYLDSGVVCLPLCDVDSECLDTQPHQVCRDGTYCGPPPE